MQANARVLLKIMQKEMEPDAEVEVMRCGKCGSNDLKSTSIDSKPS